MRSGQHQSLSVCRGRAGANPLSAIPAGVWFPRIGSSCTQRSALVPRFEDQDLQQTGDAERDECVAQCCANSGPGIRTTQRLNKEICSMQSTKQELHRRDFLKISTASTATAFGAFALAGNQTAMAATQQSTDSDSMMAKASLSEDQIAALPRVKQELVAPPFLPEHRAGGEWRPESRRGHDEHPGSALDGRRFRRGAVGNDLQRLDSGSAHRVSSERLRRAHAQEPPDEHHGAQHRFPRVNGRAGRRSADPRRARPGDGAALPGDEAGCLHLSLRPRRPDDPLPRRARNERRRHGPAARWSERREGQSAPLRPRILCRGAGLLHSQGRERGVEDVWRAGSGLRRCLSRSCVLSLRPTSCSTARSAR